MYRNGGLIFLVPYWLATIFYALPMMLQEIAVGQMFQRSFVGAYAGIHPRLTGIGITNICLGMLFVGYYNLLLTWALIYIWYGISSDELPWTAAG